MAISYEDLSEDFRRITLSGRLDILGTEQISPQFSELSSSAKRLVAVDLSAITFLASTGIRALIANANALQHRGGRMGLVLGENSVVPKTLAAVGIDALLPMFKSVADAEAGLRSDHAEGSILHVFESTLALAVPPGAGELRRALNWLEEQGNRHHIPAEQVTRFDLCLTEALANVIDHAGASAQAVPICLHFRLSQQSGASEATITVEDGGVAFDPLQFTPKPRPRTLDEAEPGGLGIPMMRSFSDDLRYQYQNGRNNLSITVRWTTPVAAQ